MRELTEALIEPQGLTEGRWMVAFEFSFGAANVGPSDDEVHPAAIAAIRAAQLVRVDDPAAKLPFIVDAASVASKRPKKKAKA